MSCDPDDLRAWGFQGLLEAKQRFDPNRGVRFSAFAHYRIRGAILDGVRSQGFLRRRAYARLKAAEATDAVGEQLAEERAGDSGSTQSRARDLENALGKISAAFLIAAVGQGEDRAPERPDHLLAGAEERLLVRNGLDNLPERERVLVEAVYFEGVTIEAAGSRLGLSKSWASRMHAKALDRMRKQLETD